MKKPTSNKYISKEVLFFWNTFDQRIIFNFCWCEIWEKTAKRSNFTFL